MGGWLKGALGGLTIACVTLALVQYGIPVTYGFQSVIYFIIATPAMLGAALSLTGVAVPIFFFLYWILAGGLAGFFIFKHRLWKKLVGLGILIMILLVHYVSLGLVGDNIQAALTAITSLF